MSFDDEFGLLKTWNNVGLFFLSHPFSFACRKASKKDENGLSISFSVGDGLFILDFSHIRDIALITRNEYAKEFVTQLSSADCVPQMIGACLRVRLAEGITLFLLEEN